MLLLNIGFDRSIKIEIIFREVDFIDFINLKFVISYCRTLSVPTNTQSCPMTMMWEVVKKIPTKIFLHKFECENSEI